MLEDVVTIEGGCTFGLERRGELEYVSECQLGETNGLEGHHGIYQRANKKYTNDDTNSR